MLLSRNRANASAPQLRIPSCATKRFAPGTAAPVPCTASHDFTCGVGRRWTLVSFRRDLTSASRRVVSGRVAGIRCAVVGGDIEARIVLFGNVSKIATCDRSIRLSHVFCYAGSICELLVLPASPPILLAEMPVPKRFGARHLIISAVSMENIPALQLDA